MPEGPVGGPRPFAQGYPIITAEFEFESWGAGVFFGDEFDADRIERKMRKRMNNPERLLRVETDPNIMSITAQFKTNTDIEDVDAISSVLKEFNCERIGLDVV